MCVCKTLSPQLYACPYKMTVKMGHNSHKVNPILFLKLNHVIYSPVPVSPISNSYQDILLTKNLDEQTDGRTAQKQ